MILAIMDGQYMDGHMDMDVLAIKLANIWGVFTVMYVT